MGEYYVSAWDIHKQLIELFDDFEGEVTKKETRKAFKQFLGEYQSFTK